MKNKAKGFTLLELIVAIAIIGVLSAILIPSIIAYIGNSKLATANTNAKLAYETAVAYCTESRTGGCPVFDDTNCASLKWDSGTRPTYQLNGTDMGNALKANMGQNSSSAGYATILIDNSSYPKEARWAKTPSDLYVGRYPEQTTEKGQCELAINDG